MHPVSRAWQPFNKREGEIWKYKESHSKKLIALRTKAGVKSIYDGLRHSYASYRIRQLKGNLPELAQEMGNSPKEIINSYKRNVTDAEAQAWFNIMPPENYAEIIYQYIQNQPRRLVVSLKKGQSAAPHVSLGTAGFNMVLEPI